MEIRVALIGDRNPDIVAHHAIPPALELAARHHRVSVQAEWIDTRALHDVQEQLASFDGVWVTPGSPYENERGVLRAIRFARETNLPFLGTCGGFQHAIIEFARNAAGLRKASHAETCDSGSQLVISPLECALVEEVGAVALLRGTRIRNAYRRKLIQEGYHCRCGLNPRFVSRLFLQPGVAEKPLLLATAHDAKGEIRSFELPGHRFFVGTLFQPERRALIGEMPPLVAAFVRAMKESVLCRPRQSGTFFLFDNAWHFFPFAPVQHGRIETKIGSVCYRGGFNTWIRPATRIPFTDTAGLTDTLGALLAGRFEHEEVSSAQYKRLEKAGDPLLLEFGLKSRTELGRRVRCFSISEWHGRLELQEYPWKQGTFWPWSEWSENFRFAATSQRALQRSALHLQERCAPRVLQKQRRN
ncbi:MAG: CTP synthase [Bryobacterales bacterium]|nr:CTP synthase [Bryobacterales bacterium]